mgnify:CR=1 FL=1
MLLADLAASREWERPREERTCPLCTGVRVGCTANEVQNELQVLMQCAATAAYAVLWASIGVD